MKHLFLLSFDSYCICTRQFCTTEFPENITLCTVVFRVQSHTIVHLHVHCTCTVAQVCTCTHSIPFSGCGPDFSFMVCSNHRTHNTCTLYVHNVLFHTISFPLRFILHSPLPLPPSINPPPFFCSFPPLLFIHIPLCPSLLFSVITQTFMISHLQEQLVDETCLLLLVLMDLYDNLI